MTTVVSAACGMWSNYAYRGSFEGTVDEFQRGHSGVANHPNGFLCSRLEGFGIRHLRGIDASLVQQEPLEKLLALYPDGSATVWVFYALLCSGPGFDEVTTGWPCNAFQGWTIWPSSRATRRTGCMMTPPQIRPNYVGVFPVSVKGHSGANYKIGVPFRPIWLGLLADTLFYAAVMWTGVRAFRVLRARIRIGHGRCPACCYPIGVSPVCTECGCELVQR